MAKQLNAEQKTINQIFNERGKVFLIPEYQRPYSWERDECRTLWDDVYEFAFPNDKIDDFDGDKESYFLGTILTFKNKSAEYEIIDGQQRLVTFMLMFRAFHKFLSEAQDDRTTGIRKEIEKCIWERDKDYQPNKNSIKIKYTVVTDENSGELKKILATGESTPKNKSNFSRNYRLFQRWIADLNKEKTGYLSYLVERILDNCFLLPIEADTETTALRIFTTLNDRGRPLDAADIFKAQFYKFYLKRGTPEKNNFVQRWNELEHLCNKNFHPSRETPLDDLFRHYMYYLVAKGGTKSKAIRRDVRDYYEHDDYKILQSDETFTDLETLAKFWDDIATRNKKFSPRILRRFYVLSWASSIWAYVVSIYFMGNRELDEEKFYNFLNKITAMLLMYAIINTSLQLIWQPLFVEFQNILYGRPLEFRQFKQSEKFLREQLKNTNFSNQRAITGAMLAWWTFRDPAQELPPLGTDLQIEHILAKKRQELHNVLENPDALEFLGNKSLLEKNINIRAADYRLVDKKIFYLGDGKSKPGTFNLELRELAETHDDFTENDINERNEKIFDAFIEYLRENNLLI